MKRLPFFTGVLVLLATVVGRADTTLVFNEIMYHPVINEPAYEWVEFHNQLAVDLDVSQWSVRGGIEYTFPNGSVIKGHSFIVLAINPTALQAQTGMTNIYGPFTGRLSNNGDTLELRNNSGRLMDQVTYEVDGDWPVGADGSGVSLAKRDRNTASGPARNWAASAELDGTPGTENFAVVPPDTRVIAIDDALKYDASGTDLGIDWRGLTYNDAAWSARNAVTNKAIPTLFNTGVGNNRVVLAAGTPDPHYVLTVNAQGGTGTNALAMQNHTAWAANDSGSSWIGIVNSGLLNINPGNYDFQTTFNLDNFLLSTVRIEARVAVDNEIPNIVLNGTPTGLSHVGFAEFSGALNLNSGFVTGNNTLEFQTINLPPNANPGGFRAALNSSGLEVNQSNPLPGGHTTYYFRRSFAVSGDPALVTLRMNAVISDGAVFYLNGVEVHRINMPAGPITAATPALSDVPSPGYGGVVTLSTAGVLESQNVLAIELHQASGGAPTPLAAVELIASFSPEPPVPVAFNEYSAGGADFWVELYNHGTEAFDLQDSRIVRDGATDEVYFFQAGTLGPAQFLVLSNETFGFTVANGDKLYLFEGLRLLQAIVVGESARGRFPNGTGEWFNPTTLTPGDENNIFFRGEIVINEIMYNHQLLPPTNNPPARASDEEWIELHNHSGSPVDLTGWEIRGGIEYRFSPGKIIPAGGYLVVADDAAALRLIYPSADIVGDFGGRLSGSSDRIVLRDPAGNPADEVRYFDRGRWPEHADGGGSSLELRDTRADNSKAEAWAASDETGKSSWQTYSYQMTANIPSGSGQPTQWNDFILGLQSGGECLIDDISVVDTNGNVQMIDNGDFEGGIAGWRVLGTHNRSRVIFDPADPGNRVLHVVATGPQEHMHNH
ncbi:MAG TPA: lamin tail domain-containing protein, partial [Verrucomicrobiae bacterium]|nr:lamin tail domain-containing protein [Verrucomicrobiae bacterium]